MMRGGPFHTTITQTLQTEEEGQRNDNRGLPWNPVGVETRWGEPTNSDLIRWRKIDFDHATMEE